MDRNARRVAVVAAIALTAAIGGVALGDFSISKDEPNRSLVTGIEGLANEAVMMPAMAQNAPDLSQDLAPIGYNCTGCDARLHNEAALVDDFQPFDTTPLPADPSGDLPAAYLAVPPEPPTRKLEDIPVLDADRTAPDAVRRRAGLPPVSAPPSLAPTLPVVDTDLPQP